MDSVVRRKGLLGVSTAIWHDPRTWLLLLAVTEKSIFRYFMLVLSMVTGNEDAGFFVMHAVYIVLIAMCMKKGSRFHGGDIFIILFVILSVVFTWMIYPDNIEKYMIGEGQFWLTFFPLFRYFIVGLFLIPNKETVDLMGKVSCLSIFVEFLFFYFILRGSDLQNDDDMSRAYFLLLSVLFTINYAFDKKTHFGIVFSVIGVFLLLSLGTRGPIMIILAFTAAKIFQLSANKGMGTIIVIVLLVLFWFVNSPYWNAVLLFLREVISSLGFSTRIIDHTIEGEMIVSSDREDIFALVLSKIKEKPFTGWGVYGEWQFVGWSAHNMYLEILNSFGVPVGGFIIVWMFFISIKAFFSSKVIPVRGLVLMFACFAFVWGLFGGGFLTYPTFLMIGYCLQICRKTNFKYLTV